ncbi:MAG: acyl-CoA dehydrogenase family protein [Rhodospirillales bacterium]|nr:acyl-CoA dehydrogenase family protein [Rhodospirillales bacterium]
MNADGTTLDLDTIDTDAPLFDPSAFGLDNEEAGLNALARRLGSGRFAARAAAYDREARFPTENYADLAEHGLLGICIPKEQGGMGIGFRAYCTTAAEIGRYCAATALTWNMHTCTCLWTGALADDLDLASDERAQHRRRRALHYRRVVGEGALYAQPFSEGGVYDGTARMTPFSTVAQRVAGGWRINGRKIFASLAGAADYYGIMCGEAGSAEPPSRRDAMYVAVPAKAEGVKVVGDWDPLGMRGTVSRTIVFKDVFVDDDAVLMPRGLYFQASTRWPHMFISLSPTYLGIAQAAFDFTVRYLRGEIAGTSGDKRRRSPTKQLAVAEMFITLQQMKALWFQAVSEARVDPTREQMLRALAAQFTVMEGANDLAQLALRTCGGRSLLKSFPLERFYRDSRCGSVMIPWTAETCLERLGRESLYEPGEEDD